MKRRDFIKSMAVAGAAAGAAPGAMAATNVGAAVTDMPGAPSAAPKTADDGKARIKAYRPLGRTGIRISDISFGAADLRTPSVVLRALDRGINFLDTAPVYGPSEDVIGQALKRWKRRNEVFIASKFGFNSNVPPGGHAIPYEGILHAGSPKEHYIMSVENSLRRLGVDHLDVVYVHALGGDRDESAERNRISHPALFEAVDELKRAGKMRYLAVSSHGPHKMETLMFEAVRSGNYDVIMPSFNFMKFPRVPDLIKEAKQRGMGVIAMKTLGGAKDTRISLDPGPFEQAAFKWVLKHREVDGLVISFNSVGQFDRYLPASGQKFTEADQLELDRYAARHGTEYCRTGCGDCQSACTKGVEIATILRNQMYFEDYGREKAAMEGYARVAVNASACGDCATQNCIGGCGYGLDVAAKLRAAHRTLSLMA